MIITLDIENAPVELVEQFKGTDKIQSLTIGCTKFNRLKMNSVSLNSSSRLPGKVDIKVEYQQVASDSKAEPELKQCAPGTDYVKIAKEVVEALTPAAIEVITLVRAIRARGKRSNQK